MSWVVVAGFFVAVLPLVLTPGVSFTLATQGSLSGRRGAPGWVVLGTATGIYVHALLAGVGLSALVMRSSEAFLVVKVVGGAYLVGLGVLTLWRTRHRGPPAASAPSRRPRSTRHPYPQAVLANVLNPKAASVYLTLAPQFLTAQQIGIGPLLVLASAHVLAMGAWLGLWSVVLRRSRRVVRGARFATVVDRVGGAVLIALGLRTLTS